jgi:hypothetical protein
VKPPIIVRAEGELMVFESAARAEQYVEHYDVEAGVYELVFDADEKKLRFDVVKKRWWSVPKVILTEAEGSPDHREELRTILVEALGRPPTKTLCISWSTRLLIDSSTSKSGPSQSKLVHGRSL